MLQTEDLPQTTESLGQEDSLLAAWRRQECRVLAQQLQNTPADSSPDLGGHTIADPGQYASAPLYYGRHATPFGDCFLLLRGAALARFSFGEFTAPAGALHSPQHTQELCRRLFQEDTPPRLPLLLPGTPFQQAVWRTVLRIPPGGVLDYASIASLVGSPRGARAVGQSMAANSLAWVIPCHRVIRRDGDIGNYRWGRECKKAMLAWEAHRYGAH